MQFQDAGYGYDIFGFNPRWLNIVSKVLWPIYKYYFRVTSHGFENVPTQGAAVLASNHSGVLPIDGMMLGLDIFFRSEQQRHPRTAIDHFVAGMPFVGTLFSRVGGIGGSRGNFRRCLEMGDLLVVFPEGEPGISKPFRQRYQLKKWRVGHVEFAIRLQVPVIPIAIIGAEEQMPLLAKLPIHLFGSPHVPLTLVPFPLPVHYHIHYGSPIHFPEYAPEDANDPEILKMAAQQVRVAVEQLIHRGLEERKGVFV